MKLQWTDEHRITPRESLASVVIALLLLPNLATLVTPFEDFPYTSAPMFAYHTTRDTPRYRFRIVLVPQHGQEEQFEPTELGLNGVEFSRYFLGSVYGALDPLSPFGHHRNETRESFEARLGDFFRRLVSILERRRDYDARGSMDVRLEVARLDEHDRDAAVRVIGRYEGATGAFTHTWNGT